MCEVLECSFQDKSQGYTYTLKLKPEEARVSRPHPAQACMLCVLPATRMTARVPVHRMHTKFNNPALAPN